MAIGGSAGGIQALTELVSHLPAALHVPIVVVVHAAPGPSVLPLILQRAGRLPAVHAIDGQVLEPGCIVVAPPDRHLVVDGSTVRLSSGPRENGYRPSVDTLFRSVADSFGGAAFAIVLSGMLDDGAYGARVVRRSGGTVLVQRPETAQFPDMPQAAIDAGGASLVLTIEEIGEAIGSIRPGGARPTGGVAAGAEPTGEVSSYVCPNCGGALWEHDDDELLRFRCRTGHAYSPESLMEVNGQALDDALWGAYRALLERAALARRMSDRFASLGLQQSSERWHDVGREAGRRADTLTQALGIDAVDDAEPPPTGG